MKDFKGAWDYQVVQAEETVALAQVLQRCTVHSGMPQGVLCGAVQGLHECLASVIQSGNMFDLKKLDMAEKDPVAPVSEERAPPPMPRVDLPVSETASSEPGALEPEEATPLEELTLVLR